MWDRRKIGSSGIEVRPIGLGGMPMSIQGRPDRTRSIDTLKAAIEGGVELIDTADVYCLDDNDIGHNERLIAEGIRRFAGGRRVVVATKGGCTRPDGRWAVDGRPEHIKAACDKSLQALGVEQIELYQLHAVDDLIRLEDTVGALAELRAAGKIAHVGLSNVTVDQIKRAEWIVPVVSVQNRMNVFDVRAFRDGVLQHCEEQGIAFLPYSPVGGGRGKGRVQDDPVLRAIGGRREASPQQVALAWLLAKSPMIVPIPGASRPEHALANLEPLALEPSEVAELDATFLG